MINHPGGGLSAFRITSAGGELKEKRRENEECNELFHGCDILSYVCFNNTELERAYDAKTVYIYDSIKSFNCQQIYFVVFDIYSDLRTIWELTASLLRNRQCVSGVK